MFGFTVFGWYLFRETSLARIAATFVRDPFASTTEQWGLVVNEAMQFGFIFFERTFGELINKPVCPSVNYENLSFNRQRLILTLLEDFHQA